MTIEITQTCNRCRESRELRFGYRGQPEDLEEAMLQGGWREVATDTHLCAPCIRTVTTQVTPDEPYSTMAKENS